MTSGKLGRHTPARYGILGGTFDPPHLGHLVLAQEAYVRLGLERVWLVPTGMPPHKRGRQITAKAHRQAMVARAIAGDARFGLCTAELTRAGPSYTVDTLRLLRAHWGQATWLSLIVGWDMLLTLPEWHDAPGVVAEADQFAAAHRPGVPRDDRAIAALEAQLPGLRSKLVLLPAPQLDLAATAVRERVASSLPIRYLVPDAVRCYIEQHHLYSPRAASLAPGEQGAHA